MPRPHLPAPSPDDHIPTMGFQVWRMRPNEGMSVPHTHPDIEVNYLLAGSFAYLHGGTVVRVEAGCFTVLWGGVPHQTVAPGITTEGIWMTLPLGWALQWHLPNALSERLLTGEIIAGPPDPADRILLERWLEDAASPDAARQRALQLEMEARFIRLALGTPPRPRSAGRVAGESGTGQIAQITRFIAQHYREPLTVGRIAAAVGLHPKYLMRVFRKQCGASVWEYLTRLRVAHAQRLLITTNLKVLDVAMESGFGSVAPFYAAFAAHTQELRPLDYRRRHRTAHGAG